MINEEVCNKSILIVTSPSALSLTTFRSFHHSLTLVALQICPLRSALKTEEEWELSFRVFIPDQVYSQSGESEEEETGGMRIFPTHALTMRSERQRVSGRARVKPRASDMHAHTTHTDCTPPRSLQQQAHRKVNIQTHLYFNQLA